MAVAKFTYARKCVINGSRVGNLIVISSFQDFNDTKWNDTTKCCSKTVMKLSKYMVNSMDVWSAKTVKPQMTVITNMQKSTANRILENKSEKCNCLHKQQHSINVSQTFSLHSACVFH